MDRSSSWDLVDEEASASSVVAPAASAGPVSAPPIGRIEGDHIILNEDQVFQPPLPPPVYVAVPVFVTPMPKSAASVRYRVPHPNIRGRAKSDASFVYRVRHKAPPASTNTSASASTRESVGGDASNPAFGASGQNPVGNRVVGNSQVLAFLSPDVEVFHHADCPLLPNRPNFRVYQASRCWSMEHLDQDQVRRVWRNRGQEVSRVYHPIGCGCSTKPFLRQQLRPCQQCIHLWGR